MKIKRLYWILMVCCLSLLIYMRVYAEVPEIVAHSGNSFVAGESQVFLYNSKIFSPDTLYVNNASVDPSLYVINNAVGKVYVYGSVFQGAGEYNVSLRSANQAASITIAIHALSVTSYEYTTVAGYTYGPSIDPNTRAGKEHAATGSEGTRQPLIVRNVSNTTNAGTWVKWNITQGGSYTIKYWSPKYHVANAVDITVQDSEGIHTFDHVLSRYDQTAEYVSLTNKDGTDHVFHFKGDGTDYVLVKNGEIRVNFIIDSFLMTSAAEEHNLTDLSIQSTAYTVNNHVISNVLFNTGKEEFFYNLTIPRDCAYSISSDEDVVKKGDIVTIYKMFDQSISQQYTIGDIGYIVVSQAYSWDGNVISEIPYAETKDTFLRNITCNLLITLKIMKNGVESSKNIIEDGDVLTAYYENELVGQYLLSVVSASGETGLNSAVYSIVGNVITIPYAESFDYFIQNIDVPAFAQIRCPYTQNSNVLLKNDFELTVIAQDLSEEAYSVKIDVEGVSTSSLVSGTYSIDGFIISGVEKGTAVSGFVSHISATNGGTFVVYSANMKRKPSGTLTGGETVRVYPRYRYAGNDYFVYTIQYNPDIHVDKEWVVWSCENNELNTDPSLVFSYNGTFKNGNNFAIKRTGYQNTLSNAISGTAYFTMTASEEGDYKIGFYAIPSVQGQNYSYNCTVRKNSQSYPSSIITVAQPILEDMGTFHLAQGDTLTFSTIVGENTFVSAVVFSKLTTYDVQLEQIEKLLGGRCNMTVDFNFEVDEETIENGIMLISENGNRVPLEFSVDNNRCMALTRYPLESSVKYYLIMTDGIKHKNGYPLSSYSVYPIPAEEDKLSCTVRMNYTTADGRQTEQLPEAARIQINMMLKAQTAAEAQVHIVQYSDNKVIAINSSTYSINGGSTENIDKTINADLNVDAVAVFVTDENGALLTNTFYTD